MVTDAGKAETRIHLSILSTAKGDFPLHQTVKQGK